MRLLLAVPLNLILPLDCILLSTAHQNHLLAVLHGKPSEVLELMALPIRVGLPM